MRNVLWYLLAAFCEIAGCYAVWMWLRLGRTAWWLLPGTLALVIFAVVLTRIDSAFAGRAFAAYGGVYIVSSLFWLAVVERTPPRITDLIGVALCLAGSAVILFGRHAA
jgi:small multidrug resistance family-3 protein